MFCTSVRGQTVVYEGALSDQTSTLSQQSHSAEPIDTRMLMILRSKQCAFVQQGEVNNAARTADQWERTGFDNKSYRKWRTRLGERRSLKVDDLANGPQSGRYCSGFVHETDLKTKKPIKSVN